VNSLTFSEILYPEEDSEIFSHLSSSMSVKHVVYPEGKAILIPYLRPSTSSGHFFDVVHEKVVYKQYLNKTFALYPAWCFISNFSLAFSGGCLNESVRFEAFTINPYDMEIQDLPPMTVERYFHGMIFFKSQLFVFGGVSTEGENDSIEKIKIGDEQWQVCGKLNAPKAQMTLCVVGEKIYVGDENNIEVFNPEDGTCRVLSVFENIEYFVMVPFRENFFILKNKTLFCVTPEPNFVTKKISKIPRLEYSNLGQPLLLFGKIFFMLDVNKTVYSLNLGNRDLKVLACFA
jgi:hypothetical protein